jgi:phospholipid transport system transporter-binding protein
LIAWQKKLLAKDQYISVVNAPEKLKVLAGVYGVSALLGFA